MQIINRATFSVLTTLIISGVQCFAADRSGSATNTDANTTSNSATTPTSTTSTTVTDVSSLRALHGGVETVDLSLEELDSVGQDLKNTLRAVNALYNEVAIQPVALDMMPQQIQPGTIIYVPTGGVRPVGPPNVASPNKVNAAMSQITPVIKALKRHADEFTQGTRQIDLPDKVMAKLDPYVNDWIVTINATSAREQQLELATKKPPYNNEIIAKVTEALRNDVKQLEKTRRSIYQIMRKQAKRADAG